MSTSPETPETPQLEAVESDVPVEQPEAPVIAEPTSLADQLSEDSTEQAPEVKEESTPPITADSKPEDIEIPEDVQALRAARARIGETIYWSHPNKGKKALRPFNYTDQTWWATLKAVSNGGLIDDALLLVWILGADKKKLRKLWRKNVWGTGQDAEGNRTLDACPMLDAFEDWKDGEFFSVDQAMGDSEDPGNLIAVYSEVFLRLTAAKTRDLEADDDAEKKTQPEPSTLGSSSNT